MTNRQNIRRIATAAATALVVIGAPAVAGASTTSGDVTDGTLDWGVKESFRSYIVSPIANGEIEVMGGASQNSDGSFRFGSGTGTLGDSAADVAFTGAVHFTGHDGALDVTISNPGLQIDGSSGSLIADVSSLSQDGELMEFPDVALADLDLSGVSLEPDADGVVSIEGVAAVLTDAGAPAFGDFYDSGEALDPVGFTVQTSGSQQDADGTADDQSDADNTDNDTSDGADGTSDDAEDAGAAADEDALPKTGAPWLLLAVGGLVLVAVGTAFVLLGRRRVTDSARP